MCTKFTQHMNNSKMAIEKGDYFDFAENINCALHLSQNDEKALMLYVCGLMKFGNFKKAFAVIEELLQKPTLSEVNRNDLLERKAFIFCSTEDFESAEKIYQELLQSSNVQIRIQSYRNLASMYLNQYFFQGLTDEKLLNEAISNINKGLDLVSKHGFQEMYKDLSLFLGIAYWYAEDFSKASDTIGEVVELAEENFRALISMAMVYSSMGKFNSAIECIEKADLLCISDSYQQGHINLVQSRIQQFLGDLAQAREHVLVAYDNFLNAGAFFEAGYCLKLSLYLDYAINFDSIELMIKNLSLQGKQLRGLKSTMPGRHVGNITDFFVSKYNKELPL